MLRIVAKGVTWMLPGLDKRMTIVVFMTIVYPLPVADELVGAVQFEALCASQEAYIAPDAEKKRGTNVVSIIHETQYLRGKAIPMTATVHEVVSESDKSLIVRFVDVDAHTGFLAKRFQLNEGGSPLLFSGHCDQKVRHTLYTN